MYGPRCAANGVTISTDVPFSHSAIELIYAPPLYAYLVEKFRVQYSDRATFCRNPPDLSTPTTIPMVTPVRSLLAYLETERLAVISV